MKKFFSFVAAALVSAIALAEPATVPTVAQVSANYDATHLVVAVYFDEEICNDLVWAGSYNSWDTKTPADMIHGEALEGFTGWYVFDVTPVAGDGTDAGKPMQLKSDGSASWDFQTGDADSWIHKGGLEASISAGYSGEANVSWPTAGVYIYESAYFKNHNSPCVAAVSHTYTVTAYLPECTLAVPAVIGDFNGWATGVAMEMDLDEETNVIYTATFTDDEGHSFKIKNGADADWAWQIQKYNSTDDAWASLGNTLLGAETELVFHYEGADYRYGDDTNGAMACEATTAVENVEVKNVEKVIENGHLVIIANGVRYNAVGAKL